MLDNALLFSELMSFAGDLRSMAGLANGVDIFPVGSTCCCS